MKYVIILLLALVVSCTNLPDDAIDEIDTQDTNQEYAMEETADSRGDVEFDTSNTGNEYANEES